LNNLPLFNLALLNSAFIFYTMLSTNNKNKEKDAWKLNANLVTEWPLCEKDEQAIAIERTKLLQKEALEKWERLKKSGH
jgi:hypothetical protein